MSVDEILEDAKVTNVWIVTESGRKHEFDMLIRGIFYAFNVMADALLLGNRQTDKRNDRQHEQEWKNVKEMLNGGEITLKKLKEKLKKGVWRFEFEELCCINLIKKMLGSYTYYVLEGERSIYNFLISNFSL